MIAPLKNKGAAILRNAEGGPVSERLGGQLIFLVAKNPNPRQPWRGNPARKHIPIGVNLRRFLENMSEART